MNISCEELRPGMIFRTFNYDHWHTYIVERTLNTGGVTVLYLDFYLKAFSEVATVGRGMKEIPFWKSSGILERIA